MSEIEAKVREVGPRIHQICLPLPMRPSVVNVYLVGDGDEWALIDTGINSDESKGVLRAALAAVGCPPTSVRKLLATHFHADHFGASQACRELTGAQLCLSAPDAERVERVLAAGDRLPAEAVPFFRRHGFPLPDEPEKTLSPARVWGSLYEPALPDRLIGDGDVVHVGEREVRVVWTPGHTPGHCCFYLPRDRFLIVGDHLLPKITPHVGAYPGGPDNPLGDYIASLRKVAELEVERVLPAHGRVYRDHRYRADQIVHHHEYRKNEMLDSVRRRPKTAYEVAVDVLGPGDDRPLVHRLAATFETLAHLRLLLYEDKVRRVEEPERVRFVAR